MEGDRLALPFTMDERSQRSSISSAGPRTQDVLIYLVDDTIVRLIVDNLPSVTARELHRIVVETLRLPEYALEVFSLWLVSPFLELQLKPKHLPYKLCRQWQELLFRFTSCSGEEILEDEPSLQFRRDIFFSRRKELQIHDEDVLRLLYEEAKYNILEGRYPCDVADCEALGAVVCRVNLGPFDPKQHTACFLKEKLDTFLPSHLCQRGHGLLAALWRRGATRPPAAEQGLLRAYHSVSKEEDDAACEEHAALCKLYHTYLQKCHELPYYGCAFFSGEIDKPAQGLLHRGGRKAVTVAISLEGVYVIDSKEKHVLLGLHFQELSWDHTFPSEEEHILWLEFDGESEGTPVNKLLKIYSKQAELMSGLIEYCVELNAAAEEMDQDGAAARSAPSSEPQTAPPEPHRRYPKLQRQESVLCSRIQHLSTIDYVEEGKEIKRVKPRRTASFFGRQLSNVPTSYAAVRAAENLEQG
nr:FERM domain-containing protein 8 [Pogona vitticeps]XP_020658122.1 FERM domain-containing protein 8 [Pogona vitticeps]